MLNVNVPSDYGAIWQNTKRCTTVFKMWPTNVTGEGVLQCDYVRLSLVCCFGKTVVLGKLCTTRITRITFEGFLPILITDMSLQLLLTSVTLLNVLLCCQC